MRQALAIRRDRLGSDHPATAWTKVLLAEVLLDKGRRPEAAELSAVGWRELSRRLPDEHERVVRARQTAERARGT